MSKIESGIERGISKHITKLLIGLIGIASLLWFMTLPNIAEWFVHSFFSAVIAMFFIIPLANLIVNGRARKAVNLFMMAFGAAIAYIVYIFVFGMVWTEVVVSILQTITYISFVLFLAEWCYKQVAKVAKN